LVAIQLKLSLLAIIGRLRKLIKSRTYLCCADGHENDDFDSTTAFVKIFF